MVSALWRRRRRRRRRQVARKRLRPAREPTFYEALGVGVRKGRLIGGKSRCLAAFHRMSLAMDPESFREVGSSEDFGRLCLALCVLVDDGRREIYDAHGLEGLRRSEEYSEPNVFEVDPLVVFDNFFEGKDYRGQEDDDIRQYLLFEAAGGEDDEEEEVAMQYKGKKKFVEQRRVEPGAKARNAPEPPPGFSSVRKGREEEKADPDVWASLVERTGGKTKSPAR